jgi:hypothetical protein
MGEFPHRLTEEEAARGRDTQRQRREQARDAARSVLEGKAEALVDEYVRRALAESDSLLKDAVAQLLGRPSTVIAGDDDRPVRIVVESIAKRRTAEGTAS